MGITRSSINIITFKNASIVLQIVIHYTMGIDIKWCSNGINIITTITSLDGHELLNLPHACQTQVYKKGDYILDDSSFVSNWISRSITGNSGIGHIGVGLTLGDFGRDDKDKDKDEDDHD